MVFSCNLLNKYIYRILMTNWSESHDHGVSPVLSCNLLYKYIYRILDKLIWITWPCSHNLLYKYITPQNILTDSPWARWASVGKLGSQMQCSGTWYRHTRKHSRWLNPPEKAWRNGHRWKRGVHSFCCVEHTLSARGISRSNKAHRIE